MFLLVCICHIGAHPDARDDVAAGTAWDTSRTNENMRPRQLKPSQSFIAGMPARLNPSQLCRHAGGEHQTYCTAPSSLWLILLRNKNLLQLTRHQSGNRLFHSTETWSLHVTGHLFKAVGEKKITAMILIDLIKAFDTSESSTTWPKDIRQPV